MHADRDIYVLIDDAVFAESPRWHAGEWWFSDIGDDKVWRVAADGTRTLALATVKAPSGLGWTQAGEMLVTSLHDHTIYRVGQDGIARPFCGPDQHGTTGTNDMATTGSRSYVSCAGRVYEAGDTMAQIAAPVGKVLLIDHESGEARIVADGYRMPNGIAFTPDRRKLIFSELFASRLLQFDIAWDGTLANETVFAELDGMADGICVDAEGAVWAAITSSERSSWQRIAATGAILDRVVATDGYHAVACALGGSDGRDLLLVANKTNSPEDVFNGKARSRILKSRASAPSA